MENVTKSPIRIAVEPLISDAQDRAEQYARERIAWVHAEFSAVDWDLEKAAPYPDGYGSRADYSSKQARHRLFSRLCRPDADRMGGTTCGRPGRPWYYKPDAEAEARFIADARSDAAALYEAFICKLEGKIGETTSAVLSGNHVWSYSVLHVTKANGQEENWKTRTILNVSKLGKVFPQYPTRKVK